MPRKAHDEHLNPERLIQRIDHTLSIAGHLSDDPSDPPDRLHARLEWVKKTLDRGNTAAAKVLKGGPVSAEQLKKLASELGVAPAALRYDTIVETKDTPGSKRLHYAQILQRMIFQPDAPPATLYFSGDDAEWLYTVFKQYVPHGASEDQFSLNIDRIVLRMMPEPIVRKLIRSKLLRPELLRTRIDNVRQLRNSLRDRTERTREHIPVDPIPWVGFPRYWGALYGDFLMVGKPHIDSNGYFSLETNPTEYHRSHPDFEKIAALIRGDQHRPAA